MILSGMIADSDWFSVFFGPATYLTWNRAYTHSLLGSAALLLVFALVPLAPLMLALRFLGLGISLPLGSASKRLPGEEHWTQVKREFRKLLGFTVLACPASAILHLAMDLCQAGGIELFWPFSTHRFSLDLAPATDPWLLVMLAAAVLFPELIRLVSDEIGSRSKRPRGRNGAIIGLAFALLYFGFRGLFHGNAVIALDARTVAGEMPRRVGAFPDAASPFLWHSIVETESALHLAEMRSMGGEVSYASPVTTLRKPEPSPVLSAAQTSPAAVAFLKIARFPKATVQKETTGYSVEIHDLKDQATESRRAIFADINLDNAAHVVSDELQWQKSPPHP